MANAKKIHVDSADSVKVLVKPVVLAKDSSFAPSLFKDHLLTVKNYRSEIHFTNYDFLISGVLLFLYLLFVWIYVSNYKKLSQIIKGLYFNRNYNQLSRDELSIGNRVSFFLSIFFIVTLTLFISRVMAHYGLRLYSTDVPFLDVVTALALIAAYSVKFATIKLLGYVCKLKKEANDYMGTVFLFCNALGLLMLPVVICLTFVKQVPPVFFIYAGMGIIAIFFSVRIIRGFILGFNSSEISKIYLFMYLCSLEILPIVILVKLFTLNLK